MARITDTRARVRELADHVSAQGLEPTPSIIRKLLGKGSPNTIVDELKAWAADRAEPETLLSPRLDPTALERVGLSEVAGLLKKVMLMQCQLAENLAASEEKVNPLKTQLPSEHLKKILDSILELTSKTDADRSSIQKEFNNANARIDGVRRYMLLQVEEARLEASRWKAKHDDIKQELSTWQGTMRMKNQTLQDELIWLKGKFNIPSQTPNTNDFTADRKAKRPIGVYPGHPRARDGEGDGE
jgi:hypothetical protein